MNAYERNLSAPIDPVKLDRLAEVAIKVGLQLQPGQDLLVTAPTVALPLVRRIAEHAYKAGAGLVTPILSDEAITLSRHRFGHDVGFDRAAGWLYEGMSKAFAGNTARLAIVGDNPMLLSGEDPVRVARASKANSIAYQPALERIVGFDINWNIIAYPSPSWAKQVFPGDEEDVAVAKLADAIFAASRVDNDEPIAAWAKHNATLRSRTEWLNGQRFSALHYSGPGTELTIGLADGHEWEGGASTAKNGITCNANIPHRRGNGVARRSGPQQGAGYRRRRAPARRSGAGAAFLADLQKRVVVLQHVVRRERRLPHRARPMLFEMLRRWRQADAGADCSPGRQQESDSYRLDDRLGQDRHRRRSLRRQTRPGLPQGRVGLSGLARRLRRRMLRLR
jgi:hypothetical protein